MMSFDATVDIASFDMKGSLQPSSVYHLVFLRDDGCGRGSAITLATDVAKHRWSYTLPKCGKKGLFFIIFF
jgi:hypothetical protein